MQVKKEKRYNNLQSAFKVNMQNKTFTHVAVFDDVFTTGNTVKSLSKQLRMAGVEQIDIWCICRA